jgi:hypothetical protein
MQSAGAKQGSFEFWRHKLILRSAATLDFAYNRQNLQKILQNIKSK